MVAELHVRAIACIERYIQCPCMQVYVAGQLIKGHADTSVSRCSIRLASVATYNTSVQKESDLCPTLQYGAKQSWLASQMDSTSM